jgi:hypothetical protein
MSSVVEFSRAVFEEFTCNSPCGSQEPLRIRILIMELLALRPANIAWYKSCELGKALNAARTHTAFKTLCSNGCMWTPACATCYAPGHVIAFYRFRHCSRSYLCFPATHWSGQSNGIRYGTNGQGRDPLSWLSIIWHATHNQFAPQMPFTTWA